MPRTAKPKVTSTTKTKVNRSQAIRDYLAKNSKARPAEIKESLAKEGIKVSDGLINAVKYKKPKGKRGKKRGRPAGSRVTTTATTATISIKTLIAAKKMVEELGGIEKAIAAIEVLRLLGK